MKDIFNVIFLEAYLTFDFTCRIISPENFPIQYGGLSKPKDVDFGPHKPTIELSIRAREKIMPKTANGTDHIFRCSMRQYIAATMQITYGR